MTKPLAAEFLGTAWLVFGGCGSAVLAAAFPSVGIGLLGVSFAFGLTVLTMAYAVGHISGCHLNPAVTVGLWSGGRFPAGSVVPYVVAQVAGAIAVLIGAALNASFDQLWPESEPERARIELVRRLRARAMSRLQRGGSVVAEPDELPEQPGAQLHDETTTQLPRIRG